MNATSGSPPNSRPMRHPRGGETQHEAQTHPPSRHGLYAHVLDDAARALLPQDLELSEGPIFETVDVHKAFGPHHVHQGVTIQVPQGQTTVLLGPSGTGKSVLLKQMIGLIKPDSGEIFFNQQRIDNLPENELVERRRHIGFLFQMGALFDSMRIWQNVCFPLREHTELDLDAQRVCCDRVLAMVGLPGIADKRPDELSGGQRKRVALARAVVLQPEVVMYDEPTTGLDPISADVINELILALTRQMGLTSLVVTHDIASARKIADRFVMLREGKVYCAGTPEEFDHTEDDLVRRFINGVADQEDIDRIREAFGASEATLASGSEA